MTQDHATPVPRRALMMVRASTEAGPGPVPPVPDAGTEPAAPVPMPVLERTRLAVSRWLSTAARIAGEIWPPFGRALNHLWNPEPETMAEHRTYIRSAAWVPAELSGRKSGTAIAAAGIAYHALIGHPVKLAMKAVQKAAANIDRDAERPLRMLMLAGFVSALILVLLNL